MAVGASRRFPALLLAVVLAQALWMAWIWSYGFPRTTADSMCFKQPAYMRLFTPHFSIPTYAGQCVAADKINSYPAVVYYYANYALFRVFGFSYFVSLAFDLVLHLVLTTLAAWCIWKATARQLPAAVFLVAGLQILLPVGRPEELSMLLVLLGLLVVERGTPGLLAAMLALGLSGVTAPGAAIVGTVLLIAYLGFRRGLDAWFWKRAALLLIVPPLLSAGLYAWYAWPWLSEALAQHRELTDKHVYHHPDLLQLIRRHPEWFISTAPLLLAAMACGVYCLKRKPAWFPRSEPAGALVAAALVAIPVGCLLNIVAKRVTYDYRHVTLLSLAVVTMTIGWWPGSARRAYSKGATAALALVIAISLPVQQLLVRYTLAPLAWRRDAVSQAESVKIVNQVIPPNATVGGDGAVWSLIDDGRPFISTQAAAIDHWPEYLISATWAKHPSVAQQTPFVKKLEAEYEEVTPKPLRPSDGCGLRVFGYVVPIASGRCDWYVRIWKRRDNEPNPPVGEPSETKSD